MLRTKPRSCPSLTHTDILIEKGSSRWLDLVSRYFGPRDRSLHGEVVHAGFAQGVQHLLSLVLSCRLLEPLLFCNLPLLSQSKTQIPQTHHPLGTGRIYHHRLSVCGSGMWYIFHLIYSEDFHGKVNMTVPVQETLLSCFNLQSSSFPFGFVQHRQTCRGNTPLSHWLYQLWLTQGRGRLTQNKSSSCFNNFKAAQFTYISSGRHLKCWC